MLIYTFSLIPIKYTIIPSLTLSSLVLSAIRDNPDCASIAARMSNTAVNIETGNSYVEQNLGVNDWTEDI